MRLIGLTGGIAAGKSTVSEYFASKGAVIIDCDLLARELVLPGSSTLLALAAHFGPEIILPDGALDRTRLGKLIFDNKAQKKALDDIYRWPLVRIIVSRILHEWFVARSDLVILDAPLLFESGWLQYLVKGVIVIYCPLQIQLQRLQTRNNLPRDQALARVNSQMPMDEKVRRATYVIDNSGDRAELMQQLDKLQSQTLARLWPSGTWTLATGTGILAAALLLRQAVLSFAR
eukprot:NODE_1544_length_944_cov_258.489385_g1076_i0.p1 GENE.NODE_1544_length_944_cov_258.489385_g1076_i0~~NODE_1544_length_944_cov_258.489385_g1076_i0.p1  ORF type:complete len:232 (+),score=59.99 NODE_1544_length_944_cov_258.489385_g1076_i0:161-856(+)